MANTPTLNSLRVLNRNANSIQFKIQELAHFLNTEEVQIACISETHLSPSKNIFLSNFQVYRRDRFPPTGGGGVAIAVHRSLRHKPIRSDSNIGESIGVEISTAKGPVRVFSFYSAPGSNIVFSDLPAFFNSSFPTILAGDFNAKHSSWGCHSTNPRGRALLKISLKYGLNIEASNSPTYFPTNSNHNPDILDIFLTNFSQSSSDPVVFQALSSDLPVLLNISITPSANISQTSKIDWLHIKYLLEISNYKCPTPKSPAEIEAALTEFTNHLNDVKKSASITLPAHRGKADLPPTS